jgi:hypothetical protein
VGIHRRDPLFPPLPRGLQHVPRRVAAGILPHSPARQRLRPPGAHETGAARTQPGQDQPAAIFRDSGRIQRTPPLPLRRPAGHSVMTRIAAGTFVVHAVPRGHNTVPAVLIEAAGQPCAQSAPCRAQSPWSSHRGSSSLGFSGGMQIPAAETSDSRRPRPRPQKRER